MKNSFPDILSQSDILRIPTIDELNQRRPLNDEQARLVAKDTEELIGDIVTPVKQRSEELRTDLPLDPLLSGIPIESDLIDVIRLDRKLWVMRCSIAYGFHSRNLPMTTNTVQKRAAFPRC